MNPWFFIFLLVIMIAGFLILMTLLSSVMISMAARRHSEKTRNKTVAALKKMLPGNNCGACGCETCEEYAMSIFTCNMDTDRCTRGGEDLSRRLSERMEKFLKEMEDDTRKKA